MSTEDNKALARRGFDETLNQRNLAMVDELHVSMSLLSLRCR